MISIHKPVRYLLTTLIILSCALMTSAMSISNQANSLPHHVKQESKAVSKTDIPRAKSRFEQDLRNSINALMPGHPAFDQRAIQRLAMSTKKDD